MFEVSLVPAEKRERRALQVSQDATTTEWALAMTRTTTAKDRVVSTADQVAGTNQSGYNKKLSYRRGTARCVATVAILPTATQQCRKYSYDKC